MCLCDVRAYVYLMILPRYAFTCVACALFFFYCVRSRKTSTQRCRASGDASTSMVSSCDS
jgi:hypothetical protein